MGLDRGVLARVDRRLLAGLGGDETWRMARIPTTPAMWATWRRYCETAGMSMGRAITILIGHELAGVVDDERAGVSGVAPRISEELAGREAEVTRREHELQAVEARLRGWEANLHRRERAVEARERRAASTAVAPILPEQSWDRVGRNEPCPCGSGRKYKRCHGAPGRQRRGTSGTGGATGWGGLAGQRR